MAENLDPPNSLDFLSHDPSNSFSSQTLSTGGSHNTTDSTMSGQDETNTISQASNSIPISSTAQGGAYNLKYSSESFAEGTTERDSPQIWSGDQNGAVGGSFANMNSWNGTGLSLSQQSKSLSADQTGIPQTYFAPTGYPDPSLPGVFDGYSPVDFTPAAYLSPTHPAFPNPYYNPASLSPDHVYPSWAASSPALAFEFPQQLASPVATGPADSMKLLDANFSNMSIYGAAPAAHPMDFNAAVYNPAAAAAAAIFASKPKSYASIAGQPGGSQHPGSHGGPGKPGGGGGRQKHGSGSSGGGQSSGPDTSFNQHAPPIFYNFKPVLDIGMWDRPPGEDISSANKTMTRSGKIVPAPGERENEVLRRLKDENNYNPTDFNCSPKEAKFFVIKSYSEDDIHRSIKYNIWCSTERGNRKLNAAYGAMHGKGPVYLCFSVNGSGHFCGVAEMISYVDHDTQQKFWAQSKWKGSFDVKWLFVKDVPNSQLRHIRLENNENKPVTNSRDAQEIPYEKGKMMLKIFHKFEHNTSLFDDFSHYESREKESEANVGVGPELLPRATSNTGGVGGGGGGENLSNSNSALGGNAFPPTNT